MKAHHVELAWQPWDGTWYAYARCRCGWQGDRRTGQGADRAAEGDAQAHERAVARDRTARDDVGGGEGSGDRP